MGVAARKLLVAAPAIGDPNFERSVVFMVEHNEMGAHGLVLNRPSDSTIDELLPEWAPLAASPDRFFLGGPVSPESVICLGTVTGALAPERSTGSTPLLGNVHAIDLTHPPDEFSADVGHIRAFAGYSGWSARQLEAELAGDAWFVVDAESDDLFTSTPELLWEMVIRRQPPPLAWLANYPDDPNHN